MDLTGNVHLLLGAPGHPPAALPESPWRLWVVTDHAPVDAAVAAGAARHSPVTPRAERSLLAAVAADDVDALGRLASLPGPVQEPAQVLFAGRMVDLDPSTAAEVLIALVSAAFDPTTSKVLRRHWAGLHVATGLAPGVPALVPVSRVALGMLLAEVCAAQGRPADAVAVLRQLPPSPAVLLATSATLLTVGEHAQVLDLTTRLENIDDISALALVARSVAARTVGDVATALDAVSAALVVGDRSLAVIAAALEERAHIYTSMGEDMAARADLEILATLAGGAAEVEIPEPQAFNARGADEAPVEERSLDRARDRVRRRISAAGAPGTFGGRHHSTYRDEIADMFALGKVDAVEELLLGLLDAVEDEVSETGAAFDPTYFLTLADLYQDGGRAEELVALHERFEAAQARADHLGVPTGAPPSAPDPRHDPFAAPAMSIDDEAVSFEGERVDVGAAIEQLLVSVGVAPAGGAAPTPRPVAPTRRPLAPLAPVPPPEAEVEVEAVVDPEPEPQPETEAEAETVAVVEPEPEPAPEAPLEDVVEPEVDVEPEPEDEVEVEDEVEDDVEDEAEPEAEADEAPEPDRPMTLLERTIRGPRVRSL